MWGVGRCVPASPPLPGGMVRPISLEGGAAGAAPPRSVTHGPGAGKEKEAEVAVAEGALGSRSGGGASSMAGSTEAAAPPPLSSGRHPPSSSSRRCCCCRRRRRRPAMPALPGWLSLGFLLSRVCCGALAGPIVDPRVRAVWGKDVTLKCIIDINETLTQITWEKIHGKSAQTIAVHHPEYGFSVQGEYQGRVSFKNHSLTDASIILSNVTFSDSGEYVCKAVTFPLGNSQSSTTVVVLVEPVVSLTKGPNTLIDGANQTVAAICTAATGKPAAEVVWEGDLGEMESTSISYPNETVTVESQYKLVPTRFARGRLITCVVRHPALEKEIKMPYVLDIQYSPEVTVTGYDGNWYIGRENVLLRCNADANPLPMEFTWSRLDGQWPEGLQPLNNTLHFNSPLSYNYTGTYVCKVANSLGQRSDQKTIYILDPPTTTTSPPTIPWLPSTDGITGLATQPKLMLFPTSPWPKIQEDNWGTIIGSAVGGALFLILVSVVVGVIWYRRRRTFRGDYFAKNYIPPSDMQKESQIDTLQVDEVDSYPDSVKKEIKHPVNSVITKDYSAEPEKKDWNNVDTINRYQDRYERPMDYYEGGTLGMKYLGEGCYEENEDDLVSHVDGSVISRKEWYV